MILLSDGTVIVQNAEFFDYKNWSKLTPSTGGSYVNGTWSLITPMGTARQNFGSTILNDGRLMVLGGEFGGQFLFSSMLRTGEIYNPILNKWTSITPFPEPQFGDSPLVLLPGFNGYVLAGSPNTDDSYVYDSSFDDWFNFGTFPPIPGSFGGIPKLNNDTSAEETWLVLPDGSVLSYDLNSSITTGTPTAQRFRANSFAWFDSGTPPALLSTLAQQSLLGPGTVLPNGKVLQVGGNENTALYTPPVGGFGVGTWAAGPSLPAGLGSGDAPGALLPDGHFLFLAEDYIFSFSGVALYDYNYNTNTLTDITSTLPVGLQNELSFSLSSNCRMLIIPNGGLLLHTGSSSTIWEYQSSVTPQASWKPTIGGISKISQSQYQLFGTRLNGISEGATSGNEAKMSTNFPLARLERNGVVRYARTTGFQAGLSQPGSGSFQSMTFSIPPGLPAGIYNVSVVANGIRSGGFLPVQIIPGRVTATFTNGILNIIGDDEVNNLTVTYKQIKTSGVLTGATVTITASDPFTTINGQQSVVLNVGTQRFKVHAQMKGGNDAITFQTMYLVGMLCDLGAGDDVATFLYNSISNQLTIEGGAGFDSFTLTGNSIGKVVTSNVP